MYSFKAATELIINSFENFIINIKHIKIGEQSENVIGGGD